MDIFGLEPVQATILIAVLGVAFQVGLGVLQSTNPFDAKKLLSSGLISIFTAFAIVMPIIEALPSDASDLLVFGTVVGLIASIAGIDAMAKNGGNAIIAKAKNRD